MNKFKVFCLAAALFSGMAFGQFKTALTRNDAYIITDWATLAESNNIPTSAGDVYAASNNTFTGNNIFTSTNYLREDLIWQNAGPLVSTAGSLVPDFTGRSLTLKDGGNNNAFSFSGGGLGSYRRIYDISGNTIFEFSSVNPKPILKDDGGLWESEGTAVSGDDIVNYATMMSTLDVYQNIDTYATWTARSIAGDNDYWTCVTYGEGLFVAVGSVIGERLATSPDGINWTARSILGNNENWGGVVYGNGLFVAVGSGPGTERVATSPDGINWTARSALGNDDTWIDVTYGNGMFVAVGAGGDNRTMYSYDGVNWFTGSENTAQFSNVTYGNGLFVAILASSATAYKSTDGINWTTSTMTVSSNWKGITYGNGLFVAVGRQSRINTSPDGVNWTIRSSPSGNWYSVAYGNGVFVAGGGESGNYVMTSPDGITWTGYSAAGNNDYWTSMAYGDGIFVAVGNTGNDKAMTSGKKLNNTALDSKDILGTADILPAASNQYDLGSASMPFAEVHATDGYFSSGTLNVGDVPIKADGSDTLIVEADYIANAGINWTARSVAGDDDSWRGVTYGNGLFVAVSYVNDRVMTSSDGINWTTRTAAGDDDQWEDVAYGNGLFVAVGSVGDDRVMTSPDGINWTARSAAGDNDSWFGVTYGNGIFVAVSVSGDRVMTSPDGINWTARSAAGDNDNWTSVTYGNGLFVAVSAFGSDRVMTSPDGITWTARSAAGNNDAWQGVTYGNGLFVAVSTLFEGTDRVMTSPDGITWTARSAPSRNWEYVTYGNGLFVACQSSSVMTSPDGINWTERSTAGDPGDWYSVAYGDGLFVTVGMANNRLATSGKKLNNTALDSKQILGTADILPAASNAYSLGSVDLPWKDIHVGAGSIYVGDLKLSDDGSGSLAVQDGTNSPLKTAFVNDYNVFTTSNKISNVYVYQNTDLSDDNYGSFSVNSKSPSSGSVCFNLYKEVSPDVFIGSVLPFGGNGTGTFTINPAMGEGTDAVFIYTNSLSYYISQPTNALLMGQSVMSVTNSWLDGNSVTNEQVFLNGLLRSWTTNGVSIQ